MSSAVVSIRFDPDTIGVPPEQWQTFCAEHRIEHSPQTVGGNVYYAGDVEIWYALHKLNFSTYWMGSEMPSVARLALLAWVRWGGALDADPEIRHATASMSIKEDHPL